MFYFVCGVWWFVRSIELEAQRSIQNFEITHKLNKFHTNFPTTQSPYHVIRRVLIQHPKSHTTNLRSHNNPLSTTGTLSGVYQHAVCLTRLSPGIKSNGRGLGGIGFGLNTPRAAGSDSSKIPTSSGG